MRWTREHARKLSNSGVGRFRPELLQGKTPAEAGLSVERGRLVPRLARLALPAFHLGIGLVAGAAVALLDLAHELVALARDLVEFVVGELAPLFLDRALHLLPVAFDAVPVHVLSSMSLGPVGQHEPWIRSGT